MTENITLGEALRRGEQFLQKADITDASIDAWLLLEYVTGISRAMFLAERGRIMKPGDWETYKSLLAKRAEHIPLQHITGVQEFMGFPFYVNEHVLVPRQDTEVLVEEALKRLHAGMKVLDLCTGSGCIAVSIEKLCPGLTVQASDISEEALAVAARNGEELGAKVDWIQSDLFEKFGPGDQSYDMIVSNPPYIRTEVIKELSEEVRLHEPYQALDGREDGLFFYRQIIREAGAYLKQGGSLLFEIGYDQGSEVSGLMREAGFEEIQVIKDLAGLDRIVCGKKQN